MDPKANMWPKMTQVMLSVRIPFNDVIAPFGESVDKIALTFRIKENDIAISYTVLRPAAKKQNGS